MLGTYKTQIIASNIQAYPDPLITTN